MYYHFKLHKEDTGYWAECCELDGCVTQGDSFVEVCEACKEALDVYLYEDDNTKRIFPMPSNHLNGKKNIISVEIPANTAFSILLRNYRIRSNITQKEAAEKLGFKNIYGYQRLEKKPNPTLNLLNKIHNSFPEIELQHLFQ